MSRPDLKECDVIELSVKNPAEFYIQNSEGACLRCKNMRSYTEKLRGFLGREGHEDYQTCALAFLPCRSLHSIGMRRRLDVAFIDKKGYCIKSESSVRSGRLIASCGAYLALERLCSLDTWINTGEHLRFFIERSGDEKLSTLP